MIQLTANFVVDFPSHCLIVWPVDKDILFNYDHEEFKIEITFILKDRTSLLSDEEDVIDSLRQVQISVSKEEQEDPPKLTYDTQENINASTSAQTEYFAKRIKPYSQVAHETINRIINFFKYQLNIPLLSNLPVYHECFQNPRWTNQSGQEVGKGPSIFVVDRIPGSQGELGVSMFTEDLAGNLKEALENPLEINLYEELISDAQSALFEENSRRGILELAIGCEILVKRAFFAQNTPAGAAFDYFEDKALVRVKVIDLIDRVAREAFGRSFKEDHPSHYKNIDHLFRCRNKIAHRGLLSYRDDSGNSQDAGFDTIKDWWVSISELRCWLKEQSD
jgi:hypothetical protein